MNAGKKSLQTRRPLSRVGVLWIKGGDCKTEIHLLSDATVRVLAHIIRGKKNKK
jgi:hypothetical protein